MLKISRRGFLKGSAAGAGLAAMASVQGKVLEKIAEAGAGATDASETYVNSTCRQCPARCGIRVRVVNGRAVKIEPNPNAPINNYIEGTAEGIGGLCPKGAAGIDHLYDPDRIKGPLKRTNPQKGIDIDPKFVPVSWDEALNDVAGRMKKVRAEGKANTFLFMGGRGMGPTDWGGLENFTKLYGSPNIIGHGTICAEGAKAAKYYLEGQKTYSVYDYDNTKYLLIFGANLLEAFRPLVLSIRSYGFMRRGRPNRVKMVYFDTRPSVTGAKADESYLVRPGTDGAIALGMAHVILTTGLWDRKFAGDFTDGLNHFKTGTTVDPKTFKENWTSGLVAWWNTILKDFTPEKAAEVSGIPAEDIIRVAKEFARTQPGIAMCERGATCYGSGTYHAMAIHALNGLVGSAYAIGGIGQIQAGTPFGSWPAKVEDYMDATALANYELKKEIDPKTKKEKVELKATGKKYPKYQDVADAHLKGDPYKASIVFTFMTNPAFSTANPQRVWEAFKDVFVVTFSSWQDDTSLFADYILPDPTYLESLWACPIYPSLGYPCSNLMQPVVKPLYDTKSQFWILSELGKRIGGKMGEYYAKLGTLENVLSALIKGKKEEDPVTGKETYAIGWTLDQWKEKGVWYKKGPTLSYTHSNGIFYDLRSTSQTTAEVVKEKVFKTPSGKFEFRSGNKEHKIAEKVEKELEKQGIKDKHAIEAKVREEIAKKEKDLYPQFKEPEWVGGTGFDLYLNSAKMVSHAEGRGANSPNLQLSFDILNNRSGFETYCWMHPDVANARGIRDGNNVIVESPVGKIQAKALVNPGCHPKVVVVPFERGHKKAGTAGYGKIGTGGSNPDELVKNVSDPDSGLQSYYQTMVKVYKA